MNKKVLQKCLLELEKPEPNISYVRGMLETSYEMLGGEEPTHILSTTGMHKIKETLTPNDLQSIIPDPDDELAKKYATGPIGKI